MRITDRARAIAAKCEDAYSFDRYRSWNAVAQVLLDMGFDDEQVEEFMRSKWTRWAADAANTPYGRATSTAVVALFNSTHNLRYIHQDFGTPKGRT